MIRVAIVLAMLARVAAAQPEWRDGCPAGTGHGDKITNARRTGAVPQLDSELVPSRVALGYNSTYFLAHDDIERTRVLSGYARATGYLDVGPLWSFGGSVGVPVAAQAAGDSMRDAPRGLGNVAVSLAARRHALGASIDRHIAGLRLALATQASVGIPTGGDRLELDQLASRIPFDPMQFGYWPTGAAIELRGESVGCYAPFVHIRLAAAFHRNAKDRVIGSAPQTIAVGAQVSSNSTMFFQYGVVAHDSDSGTPAAELEIVHRLRLGFEWASPWWALALNYDLYFGTATLQEGGVLGAQLSFNWRRQ